MSWNFFVAAAPASDFVARAQTAGEAAMATYSASEEEKDAMREQIEAAIIQAAGLLNVVQPDVDGWVSASLAGHANPGHRKREGYANDYVQVAVYHQPAEVAARPGP